VSSLVLFACLPSGICCHALCHEHLQKAFALGFWRFFQNPL
jgi:hypothetical protein